MKKILLVICTILSVSVYAASPDTLTLTNVKSYTSYTGKDYLRNVLLGSSTFPSFNTHNLVTGDNWDLRGMIAYDSTSFPVLYRMPAFPGKYADSVAHPLGRIFFYGDNVTDLDINQGLYSFSQIIDTQNVYPSRIPSGTDTLIFGNQNNYYYNGAGPGYAYLYTLGRFPVTYTSKWNSDYKYSVSFNLFDYALGYNNAPGAIYFHNTRTDTAVGWGTMSMVMPAGDTAKNVRILQFKTITTERDSFTLNSSPFSGALLAALGVTQGMTSNTYSYQFYREGRLSTPILRVWYTNNSFSTISKVWVDTTYISTLSTPPPPNNVETININSDVKLYPNPVTNHVVNIDIANANGSWSCELINIAGQQVGSTNLTIESGHGTIIIPSALAPGMYYMRISNNNNQVSIKPLTIQ